MSPDQIFNRMHWVFDMDGTLTIAQHDFDAIREELGLPSGRPILEAIDQLPAAKSKALHIKLSEIENEIAHRSKPAQDAIQLLDLLSSLGIKLGILTRNNSINTITTLKVAGLSEYFLPTNILSRESSKPKPSPEGILKLLDNWKAKTYDAVMVGDHLHDLRAGRAANVATIYVDTKEEFPFREHADICINQLTELCQRFQKSDHFS